MTHALQVHLPTEFDDQPGAQSAKVFARRIRTRCSLLMAANWCWSDA